MIDKDEVDFEYHLPGMNYCGPGTKLEEKLDIYGNPKEPYLPVDRVDEIALWHDKFYSSTNDHNERLKSDILMIEKMRAIENPTFREWIEIKISTFALKLKSWYYSAINKICNCFFKKRKNE